MISISKDKNTIKLLEIEKKSLNSMLDIQKNLNKQILQFLKNFFGDLKLELNFDSENKAFHYINEATSILNHSNTNIEKLNTLLKKLDEILLEISNNSVEEKIIQYNNIFNQDIDILYKNTSLIEEFIHKISLQNLANILEEINQTSEESSKDSNEATNLIDSNLLNSSFIENTLVISEMQGKVILPYKIQEINNILFNNNDKYSSIEDVIEKLYTRPMKDYRFSAITRFKEAYKLVTEREHKSKMQALSLASELFANLSLHPAIITACKSLDELDIYLACLEDNTLDEFPFFEVKYEIAPKLQKQENPF